MAPGPRIILRKISTLLLIQPGLLPDSQSGNESRSHHPFLYSHNLQVTIRKSQSRSVEMKSLISRMLAVTLAAATVFSPSAPVAAYAAGQTAQEQSVESSGETGTETPSGNGGTEETGTSIGNSGFADTESAGADERSGDTGSTAEEEQPSDPGSSSADQQAGEEDDSGDSTELPEPADAVSDTDPSEEETSEGAGSPVPEEPEQGEKTETGIAEIRYDSAGGTVKVIVSSDEGASEEDPSYILEKDNDGKIHVTQRGGDSWAADPDKDGSILKIEEKEGVTITVDAVPDPGYKVSEFAVSTDTGSDEKTGFESGAERFSYTTALVRNECRIFTISFEGGSESGDPSSAVKPVLRSAAKTPLSSAEPNWTKGGGGIRDVSSQISIKHSGKYRYWYAQRGFLGGDNEDWSTYCYGMYMNGKLVGWSYCVDPLYDGRDLDGVWAGEVWQVSAPMFVKALYYGASGPRSDVIIGITGTGEYGTNNIVTHVALSEIYARLGYSRSSVGDGFKDASAKLKNLVYSYVRAIEDLPVPDDYFGYVTEKNGYSYAGYSRQNFAFGSIPLVDGSAQVQKISENTALSNDKSLYSLKGARYWIYTSEVAALARGYDGWVDKGTLITDENGVSNVFPLKAGTYYMIEGEAPTGFELSDTVYKFTVTTGKRTVVTAYDKPMSEPVSITIDKKCRDGEGRNINSLEGTQFTVSYYDGYYDADTLPSEASETWVIQALKKGDRYIAELRDEYLVSGELYKENGNPVLPLGTITIKETKAAPGYIGDGTFGDAETYIGQIRSLSRTGPCEVSFTDIQGSRSTDNSFEVYDTPDHPWIWTNAEDGASGTKGALAGSKVTIVDTVSYRNLIVGNEYTLKGKLVDKETGETVKDVNGREITAEKTFRVETVDGSETLSFTFETDDTFAGKTTVAFETLLQEGREIAVHADLNDEEQTIRFPRIRTSAVNPDTEDHILKPGQKAVIIDTVSYVNLIPDQEYTVKGMLMDRSTGKALLVNGEEVTDEKTFVPGESCGETDMTYVFDASGLEGNELVIFEEMYTGESLIAEHKDLSDRGQTVSIPYVTTDACDKDTAEKNTLACEDRVILDRISYKNLLAGKTYEICGEVVIRSEGAESFEDAETVPSVIVSAQGAGDITYTDDKVIFVPSGKENESVSGELTVGFKIDASRLAGEDLVVGETVRYKGIDIAVHRDIEDEGQTDRIPDGETVAVDTSTGIKNTLAADNRVFKDTFRYENLIPGKTYRFTGKVMVERGTDEQGKTILEETPSVMTDEKGEPVNNGFVEFVPRQEDGTLDLYFSINAAELENRNVTVFEKVVLGGAPVIVHEVLDGTQTLYVPEGRTSVTDSETKDRIAFPDEEVTLFDTFVYRNLIPGTEYTLRGRIVNKDSGEEIVSSLTEASFTSAGSGEEDMSSGKVSVNDNIVTFTPDGKDGALTLTFVLNASQLKGEDAVVFERAYYNDREVIIHENIEDEQQTVHFPGGRTLACDPDTNDRTMKAGGEVIIKDSVCYENLIPGCEYVIRGKVMLRAQGSDKNKDLGAVMIDPNGKETEEWIFTPQERNGKEEVYFAVNSDGLAGRSAVVFEEMEFINPDLGTRSTVFVHEDPRDEDQTVHFPDGKTTALDSETKSHVSAADKDVTILDEVRYINLIPGKKYTVTGILMDQKTGSPVSAGGKVLTSTEEFVPETADGSVTVKFRFDGSSLAGRTLVAFETVESEGKEVFTHADLNDAAQTVKLEGPSGSRTGDNANPVFWLLVLAAAVAGIMILRIIRKRSDSL